MGWSKGEDSEGRAIGYGVHHFRQIAAHACAFTRSQNDGVGWVGSGR